MNAHPRRRPWPGRALALLCCLGPASASLAAPQRVVVVAGKAKLDGRAGAWRLGVRPGAAARVLISESILIVAGGGTRLTVDGQAPPRVRLAYGARLAAYGTVRLESPTGWGIHALDGAVVLERGVVHVLAGKVRIAAPNRDGPVGRLLAPKRGGRRRPRLLGRHTRARLGLDGRIDVEPWDAAEAERVERSLLSAAQGAPGPWEPAVSQPTVTQARTAVRLGRQRQQAAREAASCGCTEGQAGGDSGVVNQGPANQAVEKRNATLRVQVRGVPPMRR